MGQNSSILRVEQLRKYYRQKAGFFSRQKNYVRAVDGIGFTIFDGETLGLVGESGCGKTTVGKMILRITEPTDGKIFFRTDAGETDIATLNRDELKKVRKQIQMIFQDPYNSLNPRLPVYEIVAEPLKAFGYPKADTKQRVAELLDVVGLSPEHMVRWPHAFSGGQRQRIGIARALALNPSFIVADEPVSALDVSVQAQILNLIRKLQKDMGLSQLFIAHDMSVIRYISDRVAVMYLGRIAELAAAETLFESPRHPYTNMLLRAIPDVNPEQDWFANTKHVLGEVDDSLVTSTEEHGCLFSPRCDYADERCRRETPALENIVEGEKDGRNHHLVACFHWKDVQ